MKVQSNDISTWSESLADFKPEYTPVKCTTPLMIFVLQPRKTVISKANLVPYEDLRYALFSPAEKRYYLKEYRGWSLDELYYYYHPKLIFGGVDETIETFRGRLYDGNVSLLLTPDQVTATTDMLKRVYKAKLSGAGKLDYKSWLQILELSLMIEDYTQYYSGAIGFKTTVKVWAEQIDALWKQAYQLNNK